MEKLKSLEALGFSNEFLDKIEEFDRNSPQINSISFTENFGTFPDNYQNITITSDPKTAYSNITIKG